MVWGILISMIVGASLLSTAALLAALRMKARFEQATVIVEPIRPRKTTRSSRTSMLQPGRLRPVLGNCKAEPDPS